MSTESQVSRVRVFDPAMCCPTGVCGPVVDPELPRFAGVLERLSQRVTSRQPSARSSRSASSGSPLARTQFSGGGFSQVFLATRIFEGQERTYAVKVPLGGSFTEEAVRYRLEIAVLSQLRHPNIAGLVDVVPGPDDRPLLVMDYVEGARPVTLALKESSIPLRRRIELFLKVLSALSVAHERGVIHCDISAANVVLRSDGEPVIIDFGIAKVSWDRAGTVTVGPRPLTYEYASPEQYRGEPSTVRTDIYSAGVLLFELVVGGLPFDLDRRHPEACRNTVCEVPVPRASERTLQLRSANQADAKSTSRDLRGGTRSEDRSRLP